MIYLAGASLSLTALVVVIYGNLIARLTRQHARERDLMLNQLLNLAGKPWNLPPSDEAWQVPETEEEFEDVDQVLP